MCSFLRDSFSKMHNCGLATGGMTVCLDKFGALGHFLFGIKPMIDRVEGNEEDESKAF
jgi:hypothetical protein